ncbi:hypothetical protein AVEN_15053-1 [Araneus ventricosus]|uniref:Uncharacterized protein n=1 Tax=Araneus ventricosus TaxID=182803 RepID=A0A4Y2SWL1_ARAVE|nr:hypothetical protein AVEN_15053-1 [Araneus ventricosus]
MPTPNGNVFNFFLKLERLRKLLAEVETDEDFDSEDNGPGDVLEEIFQIMKISTNMIWNRKRTEDIVFSLISDYANKRMDNPCLAHELRVEI